MDYNEPVREQLESKGFEVIGSFSCRGFDTVGPFGFIGGIEQGGRPDEHDLDRAAALAARLRSASRGLSGCFMTNARKESTSNGK